MKCIHCLHDISDICFAYKINIQCVNMSYKTDYNILSCDQYK